jgi:hypothetical protein
MFSDGGFSIQCANPCRSGLRQFSERKLSVRDVSIHSTGMQLGPSSIGISPPSSKEMARSLRTTAGKYRYIGSDKTIGAWSEFTIPVGRRRKSEKFPKKKKIDKPDPSPPLWWLRLPASWRATSPRGARCGSIRWSAPPSLGSRMRNELRNEQWHLPDAFHAWQVRARVAHCRMILAERILT